MQLKEQEKQKRQVELNEQRIDSVRGMLGRNSVWYVLLVPPQKEMVVERIMQALGYDAFVPIHYRWRRVNSRIKVRRYVPYVMASRYVFLGFPSRAVSWHIIHKLRLFNGILRQDGEAVELPPTTLASLFANSGEEVARASAVRLNRSIVEGDHVRITEGAFAGQEIDVSSIDGSKVRTTVEFFNSLREVEIPIEWVEPA